MSKEKQRLMLEVAYDLISKVHSEICLTTTRDDDTSEYTLEILRKIVMLDEKLKGGAE